MSMTQLTFNAAAPDSSDEHAPCVWSATLFWATSFIFQTAASSILLHDIQAFSSGVIRSGSLG